MNRSAVAALLFMSVPAFAQDTDDAPPERFSIHGYLTQAFAKTDGRQVLGIPGNGTTDYRRAALLVRMTPTTKDSLVIQVAHRRLGLSPVTATEPDVKVDWAFYERKVTDSVSIRAGRMPMPTGLHNETRYVGTLLPFYRAPYNFYQEGTFTSETLDGASLRYATTNSEWGFETSVYAGGFAMAELSADKINRPRAEKALGGQMWLTPPVSGLKIGFGAQRFDLRGTVLVADGQDAWWSVYPSIEYTKSRVTLRSELKHSNLRDVHAKYDTHYFYGGVSVTSRLSVHGQFDTATLKLAAAPGVNLDLNKYYQDWTGGATFSVRPDVVLKGEYHWVKTRLLENPSTPITATPSSVKYAILSMSVSF